jgi:hypothetical protein
LSAHIIPRIPSVRRKGKPLHDVPDSNEGLAVSAAAANALHLMLQKQVKSLVVDHGLPMTSAIANELMPMITRLALAEATLWSEVAPQVRLAQSEASRIITLLGGEATAATIGTICRHADMAATCLSELTSLQFRTVLAQPEIALAHNIAADCEAEFDDEDAFARWKGQAQPIEQGR